jgi:hypothetical protein
LLCILGAYDKALATKDTFIANYMGLVAGKADGLYRAVPYAFVAILAV